MNSAPSSPARARLTGLGLAARAAVLLFALCVAAILALAFRQPSWLMLPAILAGWYLADLASGVVHMLLDYRPCPPVPGLAELFSFAGARDTPDYFARKRAVMARLGVLERITFDFKSHHPRPDAIGRNSFDHLVGISLLLGPLPLAIVLLALALATPLPGWLLLGVTTLLVGGAFAQYFHASLHRAMAPAWLTAARRARLLMTPEAHGRHHESLQRDFGTLNGWANPLLNLIFRRLRAAGRLRDEGLEPAV